MALHRDIYWIGRQWAVTGFGVQAVDQRLQGAFDIESAQVWDDGLQARIRGHAWVNGEDFDKALRLARQRFPDPAGKGLPLVESVLELIREPVPAPPQPAPAPAAPANRQLASPASPPLLQLRMQGELARFLPQWRVRR
jgi:hypothetical protein